MCRRWRRTHRSSCKKLFPFQLGSSRIQFCSYAAEKEFSRFEPMQKSPLCSPLESYCTEMSQPLTVRQYVPSRSSPVHSYSAQEVASGTAREGWCQRWRNLPCHTWHFLLPVLACTDLCVLALFVTAVSFANSNSFTVLSKSFSLTSADQQGNSSAVNLPPL